MERIKCVLINPTAPARRATAMGRSPGRRVFRFSMLSSLYVAAAMPPEVETQVVDEDLQPIDFDTDADLIGISFMTYNAPRAYEIADRFRRERAKPVIFGGYHPTLMPGEAIQHADAVCIGDAEPNLPRMIADWQAGTLQPFYQAHPEPLAGLPLPRRDLIRRQDYAPIDAVQATRGCSGRCRYCSVTAFHQHCFRTRPVPDVIQEVKDLGPNLLFMDDSLTSDREYAKELFSQLIPLGKRWFSQCGIGIAADDELLDLAARSGCAGLFIGFESLSQRNLRSWGKAGNLGVDYLTAVRKLHAAGIGIFGAFVFGEDDDTPEVFPRTLDLLLEANIECLQATRLTPFPGTPLFEQMESQGRILDRDWGHYDFAHVVYQPAQMSRETLDSGVAWVQREFHARRRVAQRAWRSLRYLEPSLVLRALLPVNLAYRHKMRRVGDFELARAFDPARASSRLWPTASSREPAP